MEKLLQNDKEGYMKESESLKPAIVKKKKNTINTPWDDALQNKILLNTNLIPDLADIVRSYEFEELEEETKQLIDALKNNHSLYAMPIVHSGKGYNGIRTFHNLKLGPY